MQSLKRPDFMARATLKLCVDSIRDKDLAARLDAIAPLVDQAESEYLARSAKAEWYKIDATPTVGDLRVDEMKRLYKGTFVKCVGTRNIYDAIKKQPKNDICPLCAQRTVSTLDHYLPQTGHPALVITAANLVPACQECNKIKLATTADTPQQQTLHPYFDDVDAERWLQATVMEGNPVAIRFSVAPSEKWDEIIACRVARHFKLFDLAALYASHSAVEVEGMRHALEQIALRGHAEAVRNHLKELATSWAQSHRNGWRVATYEALAASDWFCASFASTAP